MCKPVNVAAFTFWITVIMTVITLVISDTTIQHPTSKASVFSNMKMSEKLVTVGYKCKYLVASPLSLMLEIVSRDGYSLGYIGLMFRTATTHQSVSPHVRQSVCHLTVDAQVMTHHD